MKVVAKEDTAVKSAGSGSVSGRRLDLKDTVVNRQQRDVKRPAEVNDRDVPLSPTPGPDRRES